MENIISNITNEVATLWEKVVEKAFKDHNEEICLKLIATYNQYQEDERDGVDYIFNINNKEDVITCLQGGLELYELKQLIKYDIPTFFFFGVNYPQPKFLSSNDIKLILLNHSQDIAEQGFKHLENFLFNE